MRQLNKKEKILITKIVDKDAFGFRDLFSDFFRANVKLAIFHETRDVKIFYSSKINDMSQVFEEIMTVVGLVKLLIKYDLLLKIQLEFPLEPVTTFGDFDNRNNPTAKVI
ncbi:MAG: hypothetical protein KF803_12110, partial [Cyclobacteriaceae bacterium]|nr:hypothetical protein [Cyclobacteriaceae bacterium]